MEELWLCEYLMDWVIFCTTHLVGMTAADSTDKQYNYVLMRDAERKKEASKV